ncbi:type IV pilus secretin PilQ [Coralloluteibacterium thermophilus]|uniref:Type IV pilus secretin PilQ n=1 Tax=Coralloluteibacterium thermophilum TaxID=2707049 RepID=A0ABV9NQS5_9GAMM
MSAWNIDRRTRQGSGLGRAVRSAFLAAVLAAAATPAFADGTLQDVSFDAGASGSVDIRLSFDQAPTEVQAFTTDNPPRIAIDLPNVSNGFDARRLAVGAGATSAVSTAEANGRTRVVVDLFRPATYETRVEGNNLIVSVHGGRANSTAPALANPADPAKRLPAAVAVSNIDFRRSENGAGRLILRFDGDGAAADLRNDRDRVVLDLANASLPATLQRRLDVTDFATPVRTIEPRPHNGGTQLVLNTAGAYESLAYQTGNEYIVEVTPRAREEAPVAARAGRQEPTYSGNPVTFNFQDIPVRTVLQLIAEESNLNIVASDSVQGNVTLRLVNVPWDQALDIVLRAKSLDKRRDGSVVWVAPQAELASYEQAREDARIALEQRAELVTEYIQVNYGNAEDIAKLLTDESKTGQSGGGQGAGGTGNDRGFLSARGSVSFDRRTNTLLVVDIPKKIEEIRSMVELLDRAVDQVLIEARIVVASESFSRELGVRFGVAGREANDNNVIGIGGSGSQNRGNLEVTPNAPIPGTGVVPRNPRNFENPMGGGYNVNLPVSSAAGAMALSILGDNYLLDLELSALQQEGRGEVISNPRVITSNQQEALIKQGDEVGYVTLQQSGGGTGNFTVEFKEVVLELRVTPTITQDGRVFLNMSVKKDELLGFTETPLYRVPNISKREVNTAVLVNNGQTVSIGGVYEFSTREDVSKVPWLGDLPFFGNFFRNRNRSNDKAELLIFVTPKILDIGEGVR